MTVLPDAVTLDSADHAPVRSRAVFFLVRLKVKATSLAVIGVPSLHLTPERIVNVSDLLPAPHLNEEASIGVVLPCCSGFT